MWLSVRLEGKSSYSFAVVGNINNSVGIFERKIIPLINGSDIDFLISAGNAVSSGGEDKYRALYRTLSHLQRPYILTYGEKEAENFGDFRFYEHFGPYFFSFVAGNSRFIFLDSTDTTSFSWQLRWLEDEMASMDSTHLFVFIAKPIFRADHDTIFNDPKRYLKQSSFRQRLIALFEHYNVDAVFSANLPLFAHKRLHGTDYVITGGAGGLVFNNENSFYHYIRVSVDNTSVDIVMERLEHGQHTVFKTLESFWFFIHSLFYVSYINFLLLLGVFLLIGIKLYSLVFVEKDYYPDFDIDPSPFLDKPLRVAMFTNNYLPFIGGVPISIDRLHRALVSLGERVLIVAPRYGQSSGKEPDVLRVPELYSFGHRREFRIANLFLPHISRTVMSFKPDIIHLHHPFWLGSLGLFLAHRLKKPSVYNYHTRLEHYAHFVPLPTPLFRNLISHFLIRRFANRCDGVIVPTGASEEYLRIIGVKTDIYIQPTGIDYERFQKVDSADTEQLREKFGIGHEPVMVSVSRLSKEKNIDFMLEALAALRKQYEKPFTFLMIGDGNEHARLQARLDELQLTDRVIFTGTVEQDKLPVYYRLADIFIFASRTETQGMVILEAMAAGLPVVAVRSSGIDDVVREGFNGYKTPENLTQWGNRVQLLLEDTSLRKHLSENAKTFAADYALERYAQNIKSIYAHVIAAFRQTRPTEEEERANA